MRHRRDLAPPGNLNKVIRGRSPERLRFFGCLAWRRGIRESRSLLFAHANATLGLRSIMPVPLLAEVSERGISGIPFAWDLIKLAPWLAVLYLLKVYFAGAKCGAERVMHGKVVMITVSPGQD